MGLIRSFTAKLAGLPGVMRECGVAPHIIERRLRDIEQLAHDLRALKDL